MSAKGRVLRNARTGAVVLERVRLCDTFWSRFRGLQFVRHLPEGEGLLFVTSSESRANTTIHMFFMFFSIGVIWLNASGEVVDKCLAKPWRPAYAPQKPAQYFVEALPGVLDRVQVGDVLRFDEVVA
ncbi:MAG: DUF192 domain-containing protein [Chloroflexi bacterium]|nr:DUF192 domain-containing protein [Chloroflexota bacterium]MDL1885156.1 DUF192 domain-containing protein [Anaerolineae bacterium CFX8]